MAAIYDREQYKKKQHKKKFQWLQSTQASIDVDTLFAAKLQQEDREQYKIKERAKFLAETIVAQRMFRAAQRAAEIRRLYEREQKFIHDFVLIDSKKEEKKSMEPESEGKKMNYEPLSRIFPIVNWEYKLLGSVDAKDMYVYKLIRANGSSSYHGDMQAFLRRLDRLDLNDLYRMLFDPDEKDELWMNQLDWKLLKWKLYEGCGVHTLFMDGTPMEINMLVEKKYPLIKELLERC
ncbi:hypothetical protein Tco_1535335 [Tanacetum coccineum]